MPTVQREVNRDSKEPVIENKNAGMRRGDEQIALLFLTDVARDFRLRWGAVQRSFLDDSMQAVPKGQGSAPCTLKKLSKGYDG